MSSRPASGFAADRPSVPSGPADPPGAPDGPGGSRTAPPPPAAPEDGERAECVLCRRPTEYPATRPGAVLCPVCEWQEGQRTACSG